MNLYDDSGKAYRPEAQVGGGIEPRYTEDERQVVEKVTTAFDVGRKRLETFFARQMLCLEFDNDRQWSAAEEQVFANDRRAPITSNVFSTMVRSAEGIMRLAQGDLTIRPVGGGGNVQKADVAKRLLDAWSYENRLDDLNPLVFYGGLLGVDYWHVDVVSDPDSFGYFKKVIVELPELGSVVCDDFTDPRLSDMRWQARIRYYRPSEIMRKFPKTQKLAFSESERTEWWTSIQDGTYLKNFSDNFNQPLVDQKQGLYAIIEFYEKVIQTKRVLVDSGLNVVAELGAGEGGGALPVGYYALEREEEVIRRELVMPYMWQVLESEVTPFKTWPYIPFATKQRRCALSQGSSWAFALIGPQRARNIDKTNQREFVTRSIRGGWMAYSKKDAEQLRRFGSQINPVMEIENKDAAPDRIEPPNISVGIAELERSANDDFQVVGGISLQQASGAAQPGEPGIVRQQRKEETQTTLYPNIEEFNNKRALVAEAALERICKTMKPGQMMAVMDDEGVAQYAQVSENLVQLYRDARFDIRIMEGPYVATQKRMQQDERLASVQVVNAVDNLAAKALLPEIIDGSDIDNKEEIKDLVEQVVAPQIAAGVMAAVQPPMAGGSGLPPEGAPQI